MDMRDFAIGSLGVCLQYASAGIQEVGDNGGDQVGWFQHSTGGSASDAWCMDLQYACDLKNYCNRIGMQGSTAHDQRVFMLSKADEMTSKLLIPRSGYCPTVATVAKQNGRFRPATFAPSVGDLVLFDFHRQGEPHHVGRIRKVSYPSHGLVYTVEGNTGPGVAGSQEDGDGVYIRERGWNRIFGFVHYEGTV